MSNYLRLSNFTQKTADQDPVIAAEHDAEFAAIAQSIQTKADKVVGGTNGNLLELNESGELVDSGIASANLDGLTGVVQTQIDNHLTQGAAATGPFEDEYVRAGHYYHDRNGIILNQSFYHQPTFIGQVAGSGFTNDQWNVIGPTGGDGVDIAWTFLDDAPDGIKMILVHASWVFFTDDSDGDTEVAGKAYVTVGDSSETTTDDRNLLMHLHWIQRADGFNDDDTNTLVLKGVQFIPVDSNKRFRAYMSTVAGPAGHVYGELASIGWILDSD